MAARYVVLIFICWTLMLPASAKPKKPALKAKSVQMEALEGIISIVSHDALGKPKKEQVEVTITIEKPTKILSKQLVALSQLTHSYLPFFTVPVGKTRTALVTVSPDKDFAYQLALIQARANGLRLVEWQGKSYGAERCNDALEKIKNDFPILERYCDQLYKGLYS